jgi:hypothetical protein
MDRNAEKNVRPEIDHARGVKAGQIFWRISGKMAN